MTRHPAGQWALLALALSMTGCAVSADYLQPKVDLPASWSAAPGSGSAVSADSPWWELFNDRQLDALVKRALAGNLDVEIAVWRVREARARGGTVGVLWPTVQGRASLAHERESANAPAPVLVRPDGKVEDPGRPDNLYQAGFDASWELDVFGGIRRSRQAAEADYQAARYQRGAAVLTLVAEVARNYLELRGVQLQRHILLDASAAGRDQLALVRARQKAGMATEVDVARAEAEIASTELQLPVLDSAGKRSMHRLAVLLGQHPGELSAELAAEGGLPVPAAQPPLGFPSDLLRQRPDILSAERRVAAASARVGVAAADLYPKITLLGKIGLASEGAGEFFNPSSTLWSLGPSISWPIFQGGRLAAHVEVRDAQLQQALIDYRRSILKAIEDVENAIAAYHAEQARHRLAARALAAGQLAERLSAERYAGGLTDFREVLAAQRTVFEAKSTLAQSELALLLDLVALYKALGGGWNLAPSGTAEPKGEGSDPDSFENAPR